MNLPDSPRNCPLEFVAYDCFLALLANSQVRNKDSDDEVIAHRAFSAARKFREVAEMEVKKRGERS